MKEKLLSFLVVFLLFTGISIAQAQQTTATAEKKTSTPVKVSIYPNPATMYFSVNTTDEISLVRVYNIIGKEVLTFKDAGNITKYDIGELTKGIYIVQVVNNGGRVIATRRLNKDTP